MLLNNDEILETLKKLKKGFERRQRYRHNWNYRYSFDARDWDEDKWIGYFHRTGIAFIDSKQEHNGLNEQPGPPSYFGDTKKEEPRATASDSTTNNQREGEHSRLQELASKQQGNKCRCTQCRAKETGRS